jgi:predicted GH43/DUF377 family glycosyl hydrolase
MKNIFYVIVGLSVFSLSCRQDPHSTETSVPNSSGKISFSFDKANAPSDVATLTTVLTRSGFQSKQKVVNILQDTAASILFDQVEVGLWSIQIDAKNDSGKILYTGKSDVTVYENFVSQVNIVLTKIAEGMGSVQINVLWEGDITLSFKDYLKNPVLIKTGTNIDWGGVGQPKVFFDNGIYRMYYVNYSFPSPVGYAESKDGVEWFRYDSIPVIKIGPPGYWDDGGVGPGPVYKIGEMYYMLYQGYDAATKHFRVGLAQSTNGRVWIKFAKPAFSDSLSWEGNILASDVKIINNKLYMYYCTNGKVGLALSTDGINWTRASVNPILSPSQAWEKGNITFPSVIKIGKKYCMVYMNNGSYSDISFGMAESNDGINWIKDAKNPFFGKDQTNKNWASKGIIYPYVTNIQEKIRIYYTGVNLSNEWEIGFMYN